MVLKQLGVELPLMEGTRPLVSMAVYYQGERVCKTTLTRDHLPVQAPLLTEMRALLHADKRRRGERRSRRLTLGRFKRTPYAFYSMHLPGKGLTLPDDLSYLTVRVWIELYDPMFSYAPLFHIKASDPKVHPLTAQVHWVAHKQWSPASRYGAITITQEETPCGCGVRITARFEGSTLLDVERLIAPFIGEPELVRVIRDHES